VSETMDSVFNILEPQGHLSSDVISALRGMFSERLVSEIGAMAPKDLAPEIISRREQHNLPSTVAAGVIAKELLDFMRDMGFTGGSSGQGLPTKIELVQKTHPRDMSLRELLETLDKDASRYNELVQYINGLPEIQRALLRSPNWAVTVVGRKDKLDINATLDRVSRLIQHTIVQNKLPDGRYPTLLARVFGQEERYMLNPFASTLDEAAVRGPIFRDFDLGNLAEEVHLAYIWAAFVVGHKAWPGKIDNYDHLPQAFATELSGRWQEIVDDYRAAKQNGEPSTEGLSRYLSPQDLRSRRPFGGNTQQRDDRWYREQLEEHCGREIEVSSGFDSASHCIVSYVRVSSGSARLNNVISLGDIRVSSGSISGTGWAPQGARVRASSGSLSRGIQTLSWKRLYEKAVELGIISE